MELIWALCCCADRPTHPSKTLNLVSFLKEQPLPLAIADGQFNAESVYTDS